MQSRLFDPILIVSVMTTTNVSTELDTAAIDVSYNITHTRMAVLGVGGIVIVYKRSDTNTWLPTGTLQAVQTSTKLAWSMPHHGMYLAVGSSDGYLHIYKEDKDGQIWIQTAQVKDGQLAILDIAFAPSKLGPVVAVAYADGFLRMYSAIENVDGDSNKNCWELHTEIATTRRGGACTSVDWHAHIDGIPPLLVVGTATEGADIWMLQQSLMRWHRLAHLGDDDGHLSVLAVAWAPPMGRPMELIAVSTGAEVLLWSMRGPVDDPEIDKVAVLKHDSPVWQVKWNFFGNWLAASTNFKQVCLWRPDFTGEWLLLHTIEER